MFIDIHCHIDDERYPSADEIAKKLQSDGVDYVIDIGYDVESSKTACLTASRNENVYFAAGIHPDSASQVKNGLSEIEKLCKNDKCVAVGEIGLDYHYDGYDKDEQIKAFLSQIELATAVKLPVQIHSRDCTEDMLKILRQVKLQYGGVMHCFSGSKETATELLKLGFYLSFGGSVTFKNARNVQEVATLVPTDRILTETDSPYLTPHPFRGQTNEPKNVALVAQKIAELKNIDVAVIAERVKNNAKDIFYKLKK